MLDAAFLQIKLSGQKSKHIGIFGNLFIQRSAIPMPGGVGAQQDRLL
jgi:hypothetical protein